MSAVDEVVEPLVGVLTPATAHVSDTLSLSVSDGRRFLLLGLAVNVFNMYAVTGFDRMPGCTSFIFAELELAEDVVSGVVIGRVVSRCYMG